MFIKDLPKLFLLAITIFTANGLSAQVAYNTQNTGVPYLRASPDARTAGMGTTGLAASSNSDAIFLNPARIAFIEQDGGFTTGLALWKLYGNNLYLPSLSAYYKIKHKQVIAFSARYFYMGKVIYTDDIIMYPNTYTPHEFTIDAHYALQLSKYVSLSVSGRFIYSQHMPPILYNNPTYNKTAYAGAGDAGIYYHRTYHQNDDKKLQHTFSFGAAVTNLGNKLKYYKTDVGDYLPANLGIGFGYKLDINKHNSLAVCVDINKLLVPSYSSRYDTINHAYYYLEQSPVKGIFTSFADAPALQELRSITTSMGIEYSLYNILGLRAGYFYQYPSSGNRQYVTLGVSGKYNIATLAFSTFISTTPNTSEYNIIFPDISGINNPAVKTSFFITLSFDFTKDGFKRKTSNKGNTKAV